ncbi:MAG: hypothetical protein H7Y86_15135 [Rhizobacter sp.]|nr:hypothetical protein [Ferruginibacter sp.]
MMQRKEYILKEILSEAELELFLRLRYGCFSKSASGLFINENDKAIDVNYYDRNSLHYGIYKTHPLKTELVGYFRIVLEEPTLANHWVQNISSRAGLSRITNHKPASVFPCLGIYPHSSLEQGFYAKKKAAEKAGEVSRFFIVEKERSLKLSLQIIKGAFAIGLLHLQHGFVGCFNEHSKAYMKFGFRQYPQSITFSFDTPLKQKKGIILYWRTSYLTSELEKMFKNIQDPFLANNCLTISI